MRTYTMIAMLVLLGLSSGRAAADVPGTTPADADTTVYVFTDTVVEGGVAGPEGARVAIRRSTDGSSLIKVRHHFVAEMLQSVEHL